MILFFAGFASAIVVSILLTIPAKIIGDKEDKAHEAKLSRLLNATNTLLASSETTIPWQLRLDVEGAYVSLMGHEPDAIDVEYRERTVAANARFFAERAHISEQALYNEHFD
jgi:hypothetical protein